MSQAYVLICSNAGADDSIISQLSQIDSIKDAFGTFGSYDIITKLESDQQQKIQNDISGRIRRIPQIRSTLTLLVEGNSIQKINQLEKEVLDQHMAQAYVMIHCKKSVEDNVLLSLRNIAEVIEVDHLLGSFEILCKIAAPTYTDISEIVSKKIRKIVDIQSTITLNIVEKQGFSN